MEKLYLQQYFDSDTFTYTYLIADAESRQAALIDPVQSEMEKYKADLKTLQLDLIVAIDTHVHADHVTAIGDLRNTTGCATYLGNAGEVECADHSLSDGLEINIGQHTLHTLYTPGHTDNSYCFILKNGTSTLLFSGDTLLINGSGRTDFQNGSSADLYDSLHTKLMKLPEDTIVFPGHDYNNQKQSTIGKEKRENPRLQLESKQAFIKFMAELKLPSPKYMDIAVPSNLQCGKV